jgi:cytochrome c-type biogenesis protein CcmH/NrfF
MIVAAGALDARAAKEYDRAAKLLLCDCGCNPQSIKDCACGRADELRGLLAQDARSGKTADEIVAAYVAKNGQKILVSPPASGFNLVAWAGPAIGLLAAAVLITVMIRRWHRAGAATASEAPPPPPATDEVYLARLRKDVEDFR